MLAASLFFIVLIAAHHVLCGATAWFYVRLGRTGDAQNVIMDFFKRTSPAAKDYDVKKSKIPMRCEEGPAGNPQAHFIVILR